MIKNLISNATTSPQIPSASSLLTLSSSIPMPIHFPPSINRFELETPVITSLLTRFSFPSTAFYYPPAIARISL